MTEGLDDGLACSHQQGFDLNVLQKRHHVSLSQYIAQEKIAVKKTGMGSTRSCLEGFVQMQSRQPHPLVMGMLRSQLRSKRKTRLPSLREQPGLYM